MIMFLAITIDESKKVIFKSPFLHNILL